MLLSAVVRPSILCVSLSSKKSLSRGVFGQSSKRHHHQDRAASNRMTMMTTTRCLRICAAASAQKNTTTTTTRRRRRKEGKRTRRTRTPRRWHSHTTFEMRANAEEPLMQNGGWKTTCTNKSRRRRPIEEEEAASVLPSTMDHRTRTAIYTRYALNKILKDFITCTRRCVKRCATRAMGHDGLPIELKVLQSVKDPETGNS